MWGGTFIIRNKCEVGGGESGDEHPTRPPGKVGRGHPRPPAEAGFAYCLPNRGASRGPVRNQRLTRSPSPVPVGELSSLTVQVRPSRWPAINHIATQIDELVSPA